MPAVQEVGFCEHLMNDACYGDRVVDAGYCVAFSDRHAGAGDSGEGNEGPVQAHGEIVI